MSRIVAAVDRGCWLTTDPDEAVMASKHRPVYTSPGKSQVPTVARLGSYRFFFFSNEGTELSHIHVQRERRLAKFSLDLVALVSSTAFAAHELGVLIRMVAEHRDQFLEAWHAFFGG